MIAKLTTGNGFGGAVRYDMKFGMDNSSMSVLLGLSGVDFSYDEDGNIKIDPRQVAFDFRQQALAYRTPDSDNARGVRKPVYHWVLSWRPGEHTTDAEKLDVAKDFMQRIGFDDTQYMISAHYDKAHEHLHIVANIVNNRGERIPTMGLIEKAHEAAAAITRERGYQWGETAKKEAVEKAHKPHEKVRMLVKPIVKEAVAEARSLEELKTVLASKGISCVFTVASDGRRGGISFAYEYEGQLHTFRGSSLDRQLSFGYIKAAIDKNSAREVQRKAAQQEQNKMKELRAAYSQMVPTIQGLHNAVNDTFQLYNDTKQAGIAIGTETSRKYGELRQSWKEFRQLNADRQKASDAGTVIKAIGGMLMFLNPIAGLVAMAIGKIATDIRISEIKSEKKSLLAKIEGLKSDIDALQQQKAQIKIEKQERLKDYLQAKDARNEFREGMEIIKSEIQQLKEQTKPKIAFDFKAAAQRISTPTTTSLYGSSNVVKSESRFDLYSLVISAKNKDSLELALLERKAVMEPLKDSFGGVTDFRVTLAAEGRNTKASSLVSEEQLHQILDKWEALTGEKSVYRLEAERADWRKLEDICRKIDAVSPQNSPRTPKSISLLPGKEMEISYTTRNGNIQKLKVDASGILRVNGVILDVNTGKAVRIQEQNRTEKNRGIKMKR